MAEAGPLDELERARVDLARARLAFATNRSSDAPSLLLKAGKRLEPIATGLARATYRDAMVAALFAGHLASPDAHVLAVARAVEAAPPSPHPPSPADLLLDGLAAHFNRGYATGLPILRTALSAFGGDLPAEQELRWLSLAYVAAMHVRDEDRWFMLSDRWAQLARELGALSELPLALSARVQVLVLAGELTAAALLAEEVQAATEATGSDFPPLSATCVAAMRGHEAEASTLIAATLRDARLRGLGLGIAAAEWATAVLNNGLGRYQEALAAAQRAAEDVGLGFSSWALVELIEAAARSGATETGVAALRRLADMSRRSGTDWALGVEARSHALLTDGEDAEALYREAIVRLGRTRVRTELARAHLLYGEWLRRERRRSEARAQLRTARELLESMGMEAFAERARRELRATGETARKRSVEARGQLTAQEAQVAKLARDGLSNPEIGTRLFISARTVQYHLSNVFTKLGITSRSQLDRALP
jgi:DNA-binding CsgD family transcriptional regulator